MHKRKLIYQIYEAENMKSIFYSQTRQRRLSVTAIFLLLMPLLLLTLVWHSGHTQQVQLSLTDILIALRSKKATLVKKNEILTEAVKQRGITFTLTLQIEDELRNNGASVELIEAIRQKSPKPTGTPTPKPTLTPTPIPTPKPPDAAFYQKRADDFLARGEYDRAIADYDEIIKLNPQDAVAYYSRGFAYQYKADLIRAFEDYKTSTNIKPELSSQPMMQCIFYKSTKSENPDKAIEDCSKIISASANFALAYFIRGNAYLDKKDNDQAILNYNKTVELHPKYASAYSNRGSAFCGKQDYVIAFADYNKAIELNPKNSIAYNNRGYCYEKKGELQEAVNDYQKAINLDTTNELAKNNLQRVQIKQVGSVPKTDKPESPVLPVQNTTTQIIDVGDLNSRAVRLQPPVYPSDARRLGIQGKVIVQLMLDEQGNVTSAKSTSGNALLRGSAEDAARRSKFKPVLVDNQPVKAAGFIIYSYIK